MMKIIRIYRWYLYFCVYIRDIKNMKIWRLLVKIFWLAGARTFSTGKLVCFLHGEYLDTSRKHIKQSAKGNNHTELDTWWRRQCWLFPLKEKTYHLFRKLQWLLLPWSFRLLEHFSLFWMKTYNYQHSMFG